MLAIVKSASDIRGSLEYNEEKVEHEQARLLEARNFLKEKEELTMRDKLDCFRNLTMLNERTKKNTVHLSLNFSQADTLSDRDMTRIAGEFMQGIGFADQPWLLYRHIDAGHPHLHIVTTNIRPDGSRIANDLRSPNYMSQLCFGIEQAHGLTPAVPLPDLFGSSERQAQKELPWNMSRATYGEKPTKNQLADILAYVHQKYSFSSFEGFNAVLSLYHVRADRGKEGSPMYRNKGLYYRMIDAHGKKLGAPIKASAFHLPVTLNKLEQKFTLSQEKIQQSHNKFTASINYALAGPPDRYSLRGFCSDLRRDGIQVIFPALTQRPTRPRGLAATTSPITGPTASLSAGAAASLSAGATASLTTGAAASLSGDRSDSAKNSYDGHGIFYVNISSGAVIRDTDLGERYTAAAILQRSGVEKALYKLLDQGELRLSKPADEATLKPGYPDAAETLRVLLNLSLQHDKIVAKQLEQKQKQEEILRQSHRHGHRL